MESRWNARYSEPTFAYGVEPNNYFREKLTQVDPPGTLLLAAEGEGRNAVYAATQGWTVSAFDMSVAGQMKAIALAQKAGVSIDYQVGRAESMAFAPASFDVLGLIYAHFPAANKAELNRQLTLAIKPGGYLIFEAFGKQQLTYSSGGPKDIAMLFSAKELTETFTDFDLIELAETVVPLAEGVYHQGDGYVVRFFGRKKMDGNRIQ